MPTVDSAKATTRNPAYLPLVFQDKKGEWRWHLRHPNGQIVAASQQGFSRKAHAKHMVKRLFPLLAWIG